jgi:hypothetical protein
VGEYAGDVGEYAGDVGEYAATGARTDAQCTRTTYAIHSWVTRGGGGAWVSGAGAVSVYVCGCVGVCVGGGGVLGSSGDAGKHKVRRVVRDLPGDVGEYAVLTRSPTRHAVHHAHTPPPHTQATFEGLTTRNCQQGVMHRQ